jgi:hypothetical protein
MSSINASTGEGLVRSGDKPATIEEIFKNMRKYLLETPSTTANGG